MQLFKKSESKLSWKDINFETATESEIEQAARNTKLIENLNRLNILHGYIRKIPQNPQSPVETPEDRAERIRPLNRKVHILQQVIDEQRKEEESTRQANEQRFSEETARQQYAHIRYSSDPLIDTMKKEGTMAMPLSAVPWQTPTGTTIEIVCKSGLKRKLDLAKLPASWWRLLLERTFSPIFIQAEGAGMSLNAENLPIWSDQKSFEKVEKQKFHFGTTLALMYVGV